MAAWVIREEREGEPARRLPARGDRGAGARRLRGDRARDGRGRELQQRLGRARQARVGLRATATTPSTATTSAARTPRASSGRSARASRAGSPATRSSSTATRPPTRTPRCTASTRSPRRSQKIWGYETTWGSFAQFTKVQAQQLLPKPQNLTWEEAASYGLVVLHRLPDADHPLQACRPAHKRPDLGRRRRPRRVRHAALQDRRRARRRRGLLAGEGRAGRSSSAPVDYIDRNEFKGMMRTGGESRRRGEGALQGLARVRQARQGDPRRLARHRLRARRAGHVPHLGLHGQAVRQGRDLRRHHGLQPRLRRALPVDAPEGDPRLALRERVRVHEGQRADRVRPDPPGAVAHDGLRGRAGGPSADARQQAPRARSRSSSAPTRRARARPTEGPGAIYAEVGA